MHRVLEYILKTNALIIKLLSITKKSIEDKGGKNLFSYLCTETTFVIVLEVTRIGLDIGLK